MVDFNGRSVSLRIKAAMAARRRQLETDEIAAKIMRERQAAAPGFGAAFDAYEPERDFAAEDRDSAESAARTVQENHRRGRFLTRHCINPSALSPEARRRPLKEATDIGLRIGDEVAIPLVAAEQLLPLEEPAVEETGELGVAVEPLPVLDDLFAAAEELPPDIATGNDELAMDLVIAGPIGEEIEQPTVVHPNAIIEAAEIPAVAHEASDELSATGEVALDQPTDAGAEIAPDDVAAEAAAVGDQPGDEIEHRLADEVEKQAAQAQAASGRR